MFKLLFIMLSDVLSNKSKFFIVIHTKLHCSVIQQSLSTICSQYPSQIPMFSGTCKEFIIHSFSQSLTPPPNILRRKYVRLYCLPIVSYLGIPCPALVETSIFRMGQPQRYKDRAKLVKKLPLVLRAMINETF